MKNKKGFTLVELIAVIAVLAVLVLVALPNVLGVFNKSIEEVMKIEETQATDAGSLYVRDHCGRTAKSKADRSACRNHAISKKIEGKVYFCLSEIRKKGYIDEIKYKGNTKCDGIVLYDYDEEEVKFSEGKTYLICDNDLYVTPELKEKEEEVIKTYKEIINDCPNSSYEEAPEPEPNPNPEPDPTPTNSIYAVSLDNVGGTSTGNNQIYLKYGEGWYSDSEGINSIEVVNIPIKTGNEFKGYYTGQNETGTKVIDENGLIQVGEEKVFNTNGTLYASWMASTYKLTLNNDGATTKGTEAIYEKYGIGWYSEQAGTNSLTSIVVPVKKGYTFNGYNLNGAEIIKDTGEINNNTRVINTNSEALASYTPRTYSVILNTKGANTSETAVIYLKYNTGWYSNYETTDSISKITIPKKSNHFFEGYYTGENGSGTEIIDENGNINSGQTTIFSNETNTGVLYAKWKEDNSCSTANITYIGYVESYASKMTIKNEIHNIEEVMPIGSAPLEGKSYNEFGVGRYTYKGDYRWRVYSQSDDIYISSEKTTNVSKMQVLSFISWWHYGNSKFYIYKVNCVKRPSNFMYVGNVHKTISGNDSNYYEMYVVDAIGNKKEKKPMNSMNLTGIDYSEFGISYFRYTSTPGTTPGHMWRVFARNDDIYYSYEETIDESKLIPLSFISFWAFGDANNIYLYKKGSVKKPSSYAYLGRVHTNITGNYDSYCELGVIDKINNKKERLQLSDAKSEKSYSGFGVGYSIGNNGANLWRIFAEDDDIYYSYTDTTNEADLKPLSYNNIQPLGDSKVIYLYKKGSVKKPSSYTYLGTVHPITNRNASNGDELFIVDKIKNKKEKRSISEVGPEISYSGFGIGYSTHPSLASLWRVYSEDDDIYYSYTDTTNEADLKPLSYIHFATNRDAMKVYLYKKGSIKVPSSYTYIGSVHPITQRNASNGDELFIIDKITNIKEKKKIGEVKSNINYSGFGVGYGYYVSLGDLWNVYNIDNDIYYSMKETNNASDLTKLSSSNLTFATNVEAREYYLYKKK